MAIEKGVISTIGDGGKTAAAVPSFSDTPVSATLTVPFYLIGCLEPGMAIVYVQFQDNTGVVLARMDGEWSHTLRGDVSIRGNHTVTGAQTVTGTVTAANLITETAAFNSHTHTCPDGGTSGPH